MSERFNDFSVRGTVDATRSELITLAPNLKGGFHHIVGRRGLLDGAIPLSASGFECGHNSDAQDETECEGVLLGFQKLHDSFLTCVAEISLITSSTKVKYSP